MLCNASIIKGLIALKGLKNTLRFKIIQGLIAAKGLKAKGLKAKGLKAKGLKGKEASLTRRIFVKTTKRQKQKHYYLERL